MNLSPLAAATDTTAPATGAAPGSADAESAFDNILALETLAAAAPQFDASLEDITVQEDDTTEDGDIEDLLAFLSSLINTPVLPQGPMTAQPGGDMSAEAMAANGGQGGNSVELAPTAPGAGEGPDFTGSTASDKLPAAMTHAFLDSAAVTEAATGADSGAPARGPEWAGPAARQPAATESARIATPVRDPRWVEDFGTRIALMVRGGESSASLQLSPVELGPMDVSVTVRDSQASIHFGAAQAETRALIEASIPRLREMLAAQGFQLMDASVSQGFARHDRPGAQGAPRAGVESETETIVTRSIQSLGLLDLYA
jgi:flagellar hook-length control protein FliK